MKTCSKCKTEKRVEDFYPAKHNTTTGLASWCKECSMVVNRECYLRRTYGLGNKEYEEILESQNYGCAICGKREDTFLLTIGKTKLLAVDHDKETERIRGILCENCNRGIGLLKHDIEILKKAVDYLNQF